MSYAGIDVSKWQGTINWSNVKSAGVKIAIIKAGGGDVGNYKDSYFTSNIIGAQKVGLKTGVYWFFNAYTDPITQAEYYYNIIKSYAHDCVPVIDVENGADYGTTELVRRVQLFRLRFTQLFGYWPIVYANENYCLNYLNDSRLKEVNVWVAKYSKIEPATGVMNRVGWQYSSTGSVNGVNGNVDKNSFEDGMFKAKSNISNTNGSIQSSNVFHLVVSGDTVWAIAKRYGVTVAAICTLNPVIGDGSLIYPGQILTIKRGEASATASVTEKKAIFHLVVSGDTVTEIAKKHGTTVAKICSYNPVIGNGNLIYPGQILRVSEYK